MLYHVYILLYSGLSNLDLLLASAAYNNGALTHKQLHHILSISNRNNHVTYFVSLIHISMCFDHLF